MRPVLVLAAMLVASAPPALAAPSPMFEQFRRLCLSTRAQPAAVAKAVTGSGWTTVERFPTTLLLAYGGPFEQVTVRSRPAPADDNFLLVSGVKAATGKPVQVCTLSGPFDAGAAPALQAWLGGVRPLGGEGPDGLYTILETSGGRRAPSRLELQDAANRNRLTTVVVTIVPDEVITLSAAVAP